MQCTCTHAAATVPSPANHIDKGYLPGTKIWTPGCPVCPPPGEDDHYAFETRQTDDRVGKGG